MKVSVIIPCYNEEEVLPLSHKRFSQVMEVRLTIMNLFSLTMGAKTTQKNFYSVSPTMILIQK